VCAACRARGARADHGARVVDLPTQGNILEFFVRVIRASAKLPCTEERERFGASLKV
jgi:hypothetical protein